MFKYIYSYYYNLIDTPSTQFKLNIWAFINIKFNKIKISNQLVYFISTLTSIQQNYIKIFHKNFTFHNFFFYFIFFFLFYIFFFIIIL